MAGAAMPHRPFLCPPTGGSQSVTHPDDRGALKGTNSNRRETLHAIYSVTHDTVQHAILCGTQ